MKTTTIDLFEHWELIPKHIQDILVKYEDKTGYLYLDMLSTELKPHGYIFSYGLDGTPYGLHKMKFCK